MEEYQLHLHFSYFNAEYNKMYFVQHDHPQTAHVLKRLYPHEVPTSIPVSLPRGVSARDLPQSIKAKIGLKCIITVTSRYINLRSRADHNFGDQVKTIALQLVDIADAPQERVHVRVTNL
jgi:hypothetical protein